jgi:hypothetical protein
MKKILFIAFLAIISTAPAYAADRGHGGGGGGWGRGGGWAGGWGWGGGWIGPALIGGAIAYDLSYPYYPYYPYPVYQQPYPVYTQPAPVYAPSVAPSSVQYWYFCAAANGYYPYVPSCPSGWQAVPTTPPR